jgi:membrane protein required for colicin V production
MDSLPMNPVDMAVIAIVLLSAFLAFTRGFVAEVVSIVTWIGSAVITLYALPHALPLAQTYIKHELLAYAAAAVGVFVVSLILLTMIGGQISNVVQASRLSAIDRSLGFAFGLAKGAVLVSVAYLFFAWLVPETEHPAWLTTARTEPFLRQGAQMIVSAVPESIRNEALSRSESLRQRTSVPVDLMKSSTPVPAAPKADTKESDKGYKPTERGAINQLIQQNAGSPAPAN